jgi:hypothetical protein
MALAQTGIKSFARENVNKAPVSFFHKQTDTRASIVDGRRFLGIISRHVAASLDRMRVKMN